ncbi:MAG: DUF4910 domain-containing protein [Clostridia bacterium]|nr:DUF4910 domain-containing protein [Clostridia bacterium]
MDIKKIKRILKDTAFPHVSGTPEELKVAQYLAEECRALGVETKIEEFQVAGGEIQKAVLTADGKEIPCNGYMASGNADITAPFIHLREKDKASFTQVKDKIVILDGWLEAFDYKDIAENGSLGFIITNGNVNFKDSSPDKRYLAERIVEGAGGKKLPGLQIHVKDAAKLVKSGAKELHMVLKQKEFPVTMRNVTAEIPGKRDEWIVCTAHLDSTYLSKGTWDNMTGCIALLGIMEELKKTAPNNYGVRFVFCGGEEEDLYGSKNYLEMHKDEIDKMVLDINVDMIGETMGSFEACCTAEEKLSHYLSYLAMEIGWGMKAYDEVYSSDSTPFADKGIPAVTFARMCGGQYASFHNCYDTEAILSPQQIQKDVEFIAWFADRMANAVKCPVDRKIPKKLKKKIDVYLERVRKEDADEDE